ncbi:MAG: outer rane lipoprotein carrier protein [Campylobacterota bacterium]|nr:outer rane lipoprotein carrier protein [Campylobacterota bacterium]
MKYYFLLLFLQLQLFASLDNINSFEADFTQSITDEKNKTISYTGHIVALKPDNARWTYAKPVKKDVFMNSYDVVIVESEIEQVIIRKVESNFDFFNMIANAKKIKENVFTTNYKDTVFTIVKKGALIESISYKDEFENKVHIVFKNQKQNKTIEKKLFIPSYPLEYDVIRD